MWPARCSTMRATAADHARRAWTFDHESARRTLLDQFQHHGLEGFGLERHAVRRRCGRRPAPLSARHAEGRPRARAGRHVYDAAPTPADRCGHAEASEVVEPIEGGREGSLLDEIDRTVTSMAGRLLRPWLLRPLSALDRIRDRLDAVEEFAFRSTDRGKFRDALKVVQDLERLVARTALGTPGRAIWSA